MGRAGIATVSLPLALGVGIGLTVSARDQGHGTGFTPTMALQYGLRGELSQFLEYEVPGQDGITSWLPKSHRLDDPMHFQRF